MFFSLTLSTYAQNKKATGKKKEKTTETKSASSLNSPKMDDTNSPKLDDTKDAPVLNSMLLQPVITDMYTVLPPKKIKLKVTLLELQSATTQNGSLAHLSINQQVQYKSLGKIIKPISVDKNFDGKYCDFGSYHKSSFFGGGAEYTRDPGIKGYNGWIPLACGGRDSQIHVTQSKLPLTRSPNVNNSVVYEISDEEIKDKNAEFIIDTFVVEYSTSFGTDADIILNHDPRRINVAIHDVLAILQGNKKINEDKKYLKDGSVPQSLLFDHFDGISLPLRNVNKNGKIILEGPIRARNKGSELVEKAFVWMRFELID